jgi:Na+/H+-dicarboxylate symporter
MILGAAAGWLLPGVAPYVSWLGDLFIRLIRMIVIPLVFVTILVGVASLGNSRRLGQLGGRALVLFTSLVMLAAWIGIAIACLLGPGRGPQMVSALATAPAIPSSSVATVAAVANTPALRDQLLSIVPINPFAALATGDMLAVIFFAAVLGAGLLYVGASAQPLEACLRAANLVLSRVVSAIMETAPIGVFSLTASAMARAGTLPLSNMSLLALCVVGGSLVLTLAVHITLIRVFARMSPAHFLSGASKALLIALSTGSSSAVLPTAIDVAEQRLGVSRTVSSTVLPLGASIGRDGTAMYVSLLAIFAAQAFGMTLHFRELIAIVLTTTLVALATAPVPSASLFMLAAVLSSIGIDAAHAATVVGFILPFDALFNMVRTVPNATSNLCVALLVNGNVEQSAALDRRPASPADSTDTGILRPNNSGAASNL